MKYRLPILLAFLLFMAVPAVQAQQEEHIAIAEQVRGIDSSSTGFVADLLTWYDSNMNYTAVGALMTTSEGKGMKELSSVIRAPTAV